MMKYNSIYQHKFTSWSELEKIIESFGTTKEKGNAFEDFVYVYLTIKKDLYQIKEIYRVNEIPKEILDKYQIERTDAGIDGLYVRNDGTVTAYQAKFRNGREKPSYEELTKFWQEARYVNYQFTIANSYSLTPHSKKNPKHYSILVEEFDKLDSIFFEQLFLFTNQKSLKIRKPFKPYPYQEDIIKDVINGFCNNDRGKLIAACGTGKTLTALWISEALKSNTVLFIVPSLALIKQTLEAWVEQYQVPFSFLCVCSDRTVAEQSEDMGDLTTEEVGVPVTRDKEAVVNFLKINSGKRVIFCTYQSLDVIESAFKDSTKLLFDITFFDEAHRTAGSKDESLFALALDDKSIKSSKRLFMTATERIVRPWIIDKAKEYDRVIFSMDDTSIYGPVFHRLNFGEAIKKKLILDYKIVIAGIKNAEVYDLIKANKQLVENSGDVELFTYAQNVCRQQLLINAFKDLPIKKAITFHNTVNNAKAFITGIGQSDLSLEKSIAKEIPNKKFFLSHINGSMSAGDRKLILTAFEKSDCGIISNSKCLTEGVDVPLIDCVYFVNPKSSLIDIIQACGRALRKPKDNSQSFAYFIVPIVIPENIKEDEIINLDDFEMLHNLIQSLRDQDSSLEDIINQININVASGKTKNITSGNDKFCIKFPEEFKLETFAESLYTKIGIVNSNPTSFSRKTIVYGHNDRKSEIPRLLKTVGDYNIEAYETRLVKPTIEKFGNNETANAFEIKINHNNVSHTKRLGLIKADGFNYRLTDLGRKYKDGKIQFNQIIKTAMMSSEDDKPSSYKFILDVLLKVKSINFIEFAFCLYSTSSLDTNLVDEVINNILIIRNQFPHIELTNEKNKDEIIIKVNNLLGTILTKTDIWAKNTTIKNQFDYFRNHLSVFDHIDTPRGFIKLKDTNQ